MKIMLSFMRDGKKIIGLETGYEGPMAGLAPADQYREPAGCARV